VRHWPPEEGVEVTASYARPKVVLASGNAGKVREFNQLLGSQHIEVVPQSHFGVPEAAETGLTFVENAILKARNAALHTGLPAVADDSGIEVDALGGAPGVHSARYAGPRASDADNVDRLLAELADVPDPRRSARFRCVMVYVARADDPQPLIGEGVWEGRITRTPRGIAGFGYDPVFEEATGGRTAAELPASIKNQRSHRAMAWRALEAQLRVLG
jgi:XTP/dITP diphosphohydrolase